MENKTEIIYVRTDPNTRRILSELSQQIFRQTNVSAMVRKIIYDYLDEHENGLNTRTSDC
jgi:hypothetical protein